MAQITIKNFKGINLREGNWADAFASYASGIDLFGLADNANKISRANVLQSTLKVCAMSGATSGNGVVTEEVQDFAYFDTANPYWYAIGRVNNARLYRLNSGTWEYVSAINTSGNGNNLIQYGANLYYATHTYLGQYDGTNGNANFQAFTDTISAPRPMKVFNGSLFIGQGRYVDKYDGTTYSSQKLTLPANYDVRSIEIYQNRLFISADNAQISQIFVWDGISNTFESAINILGEAAAPSLITANNILWAVSNRGTSIPTTGVWTYTGSSFEQVFDLPFPRENQFAPPNSLAVYRTGILIGGEEGASAKYEDGGGGLWFVGKNLSENVYYAVLLFLTGNTPLRKAFNGTVASKGIVYVGITDTTTGTSYEIHQVDFTNYYVSTGIWQSLPIDAGSTEQKVWHGIKINADTLAANQTVTILYRLDDGTAFTSLKQFTSGDMEQYIPIGLTSRTITIRLQIATGGADANTTRIHSFTLDYTPTKI